MLRWTGGIDAARHHHRCERDPAPVLFRGHGRANKAILDASGVDPSGCCSRCLNPRSATIRTRQWRILQRIVDLNVRIAIDNFGSGLAPLNHLVRLPIDMVKLDPRLAMAATSGGRQHMLVQTLIQLGRSLGVQMVAQGIETAEQLDALCRLGCELGQGPCCASSGTLPAQKLVGARLLGAHSRSLIPAPSVRDICRRPV